jgi:hypothetical protein
MALVPNPLRLLASDQDRERCSACGAWIRPGDDRVRLRGRGYAHRSCAIYTVRRRHPGRLGYP